MIDLCSEMIVPKFGEYNCIHELDSKLEIILCWVRDNIEMFKK